MNNKILLMKQLINQFKVEIKLVMKLIKLNNN